MLAAPSRRSRLALARAKVARCVQARGAPGRGLLARTVPVLAGQPVVRQGRIRGGRSGSSQASRCWFVGLSAVTMGVVLCPLRPSVFVASGARCIRGSCGVTAREVFRGGRIRRSLRGRRGGVEATHAMRQVGCFLVWLRLRVHAASAPSMPSALRSAAVGTRIRRPTWIVGMSPRLAAR